MRASATVRAARARELRVDSPAAAVAHEPAHPHADRGADRPTLLRLAAPNVLVMVAQASVGLIETYFVGQLGTDALAGVSLVFPAVMLMQMMSAGAMGGGISSAIARALGGGRRADADALVLHALAIAVVFGLAFMVAVLVRRPLALRRHGRPRRLARRGAHLFERGVLRRRAAVGLSTRSPT